MLKPEDLSEIDQKALKIDVQGQRLPEAVLKMTRHLTEGRAARSASGPTQSTVGLLLAVQAISDIVH
ncbi:hypothetical protein D9M69_617270 [compost metagenome]